MGGPAIALSRPPLVVVLLAVLLLALGETGGAVMSQLRGPTERWAAARVAANARAHGLSGSVEYDDEGPPHAVYVAEAGAPSWRPPPGGVPPAPVVSTGAAGLGGPRRGPFKVGRPAWGRGRVLARPAVHRLVGVRDVDERILDEALVKFDAALRLFHLHAEGMG